MEKGIKASWALTAFASDFKRVQVGNLVNKGTGEVFKSVIFTKGDGSKVFVGFSSRLKGVNGAKDLVSQKDELQVVQLNSGNYKLCRQGNAWEDVVL